MSGTDRNELCAEPKNAASWADKMRKAPAGAIGGGPPPGGPKKEPVRVSGPPKNPAVPLIPQTGVSK